MTDSNALQLQLTRQVLDAALPVKEVEQLLQSDAAIEAAIDAIARELRDSITTVWSARQIALHRLAALGDAVGSRASLKIATCCTAPLVAQLHDLRSAIVKDACCVIAHLSKSIGDDVEARVLFETVVHELIGLVFQKKKVMALSSHEGILAILAHVRDPLMVDEFLHVAKAGRHPLQRQRCIEYIARVISAFPDKMVNDMRCSIEEQIALSMQDSDGEVRAAARQTFWTFHRRFPQEGATMLDSMDPKTRQRMFADRNGVSAEGIKPRSTPPWKKAKSRIQTTAMKVPNALKAREQDKKTSLNEIASISSKSEQPCNQSGSIDKAIRSISKQVIVTEPPIQPGAVIEIDVNPNEKVARNEDSMRLVDECKQLRRSSRVQSVRASARISNQLRPGRMKDLLSVGRKKGKENVSSTASTPGRIVQASHLSPSVGSPKVAAPSSLRAKASRAPNVLKSPESQEMYLLSTSFKSAAVTGRPKKLSNGESLKPNRSANSDLRKRQALCIHND